MKSNNFNDSEIIAKNAIQMVLSFTFRSILIDQVERTIPTKTLADLQKNINMNLELMFSYKNKQNKIKQVHQPKIQEQDNYSNGVKSIKNSQIEKNIASLNMNSLQHIQNKISNLDNQIQNTKQNSFQSNQLQTKQLKPNKRKNKLSKSQKFIQILSQAQIAERNQDVVKGDSLRMLLDERRQKQLQSLKNKNQNKYKIIKRQKQIKQKLKNLNQFSYNFDGTPLTIKQSNKNFMTNREDFIEMRTHVLRKVIKRKKDQFVDQLSQQVNYQKKSKKLTELNLNLKNKKTYHREISLNLNSPTSILELFSSKTLLQKGIKIKQKIKEDQKELYENNISDLQSKPIQKMNRQQFKELFQKKDFVPTSKILFQANQKRSKSTISRQNSQKQPQIKMNNSQIKPLNKSKSRYSQYRCVTQPSQSNFTSKLSAIKSHKRNFQFSQSQNKTCKISVTDQKSFQTFINLSRCS